jgi:hypothetical protein
LVDGNRPSIVTNVESALLDIAIMVVTELLVMVSLPHDSCHPLFLEAVEVDATSLLIFTFIVELYARCSKGDIGRKDGLQTVY